MHLKKTISHTIVACVLAAFFAGCAGGSANTTPAVSPHTDAATFAPVPKASSVRTALEGTSQGINEPIASGDDALTLFVKNACTNPKFPLVCVKQGRKSTLSIQENCYVNGQPVSCGTVTWSATTSNKGLRAAFSPNPGNPVIETIAATKTIPVGRHYYQLITAVCTGVPNCPANYKASIYVLK